MKYIDEFRNPEQIKALLSEIDKLATPLAETFGRPVQVMEVCGGHTHTVFKYGLHQLITASVEFVHGPGCPVCVLPAGVVDECVKLAMNPQVIFTSFGDALRVPGYNMSLQQAKARGADVRIVYSPLDSLQLARENPDKTVVFFAIGFETTMPSTALTVLQAAKENVTNFNLLCSHITIMPTLQALLEGSDVMLDGFIGPGHVSMVIGRKVYQSIAEHYHKPLVISGFEPSDILQSLMMVLKQLATGRCEIENQYSRAVAEDGNPVAVAAMEKVFDVRESFSWRGLGSVPWSGVKIRDEFAAFDAEKNFPLIFATREEDQQCQCDQVLIGKKKPSQCALFGKGCTPATPVGALMVSSEGACSAYYQYDRIAVVSHE